MSILVISVLPVYFLGFLITQFGYMIRKNKEINYWNGIVNNREYLPDDFYLKDYSIIKALYFIFFAIVVSMSIIVPELMFPFLYAKTDGFNLINYLALILLILNVLMALIFLFVSKKHEAAKERIHSWYSYLYSEGDYEDNNEDSEEYNNQYYEQENIAPQTSFKEEQEEIFTNPQSIVTGSSEAVFEEEEEEVFYNVPENEIKAEESDNKSSSEDNDSENDLFAAWMKSQQ